MLSKRVRQSKILDFVKARSVSSQEELLAMLAPTGIRVTQATLSRDIRELGLVKVRGVYRPIHHRKFADWLLDGQQNLPLPDNSWDQPPRSLLPPERASPEQKPLPYAAGPIRLRHWYCPPCLGSVPIGYGSNPDRPAPPRC